MVGGRLCVNFWFLDENFSLLWSIDTELGVNKFNMFNDTALECYRCLWNVCHCFGVTSLVVENLVFALPGAAFLISSLFHHQSSEDCKQSNCVQVASAHTCSTFTWSFPIN